MPTPIKTSSARIFRHRADDHGAHDIQEELRDMKIGIRIVKMWWRS